MRLKKECAKFRIFLRKGICFEAFLAFPQPAKKITDGGVDLIPAFDKLDIVY